MIRYPRLNGIKRTTLAAAVSVGLGGLATVISDQVQASDSGHSSGESLQLVCRDSSLLTVAAGNGIAHSSELVAAQRASSLQGISGSDSRGISGSDSRGISGSDSRGISGSDSRGISGSDSRGISGSDSRGISGSDSRGISGSDSRGISGSDSRGISGSDSRGISGSDSRGISGSDSRGISGSDSRGISGSDSRGISGSDSRGISGSDSRGISGSDSRSLVGDARLAAVGPIELLEVSEAGTVVTILGQQFMASVDLSGCVETGDYVVAGAGDSGELTALAPVGIGYVPGASEVWLRAAITGAAEDVGLMRIGALDVDYTPYLSGHSDYRPEVGTLVEISGTQPVLQGTVILGISGSDSR